MSSRAADGRSAMSNVVGDCLGLFASNSYEDAMTSKICYLDFDGVTHFAPVYWNKERGMHFDEPRHNLFEWAPLLKDLLGQFPEVEIVLSTAWVRAQGFDYAKSMLPLALQARVIGATFDNRFNQELDFDLMPRGLQVFGDVVRRRPSAWFAIDNDGQGWPQVCSNQLIKTDDSRGLSEPMVQDALLKMLTSL